MGYNDYVIESILANNQYGITAVNDLRDINTIYLDRKEFPIIEKLIQSNDIEAIQNLQDGFNTGEYLDIMSFNDQESNPFILVIYDSIAFEQAPKIIDIYKVK